MNFSYWDQHELIGPIDFVVIGSGITGLATAIHLREANPGKHVVVLERAMMPWGASSRNAGFACFGSLGEILSDLEHHSEEEVFNLVKSRKEGLDLLRNLLGDRQLQYEELGGFEIFRNSEEEAFRCCRENLSYVNKLLQPLFEENVYSEVQNDFGFSALKGVIKNHFEGQLNPGRMMHAFIKKAELLGVRIFNGAEVKALHEEEDGVRVELPNKLFINTHKALVCTNGLANNLLDEDVQPARNQVLITHEIKDLPFQGAFHADEGHLYFRNVDQRVLIGGGRNLNANETGTADMQVTEEIQQYLEKMLREVVLPHHKFEVDMRWAGTLGLGQRKTPLLQKVSPHVFCAVRLGGMGVAIGSMLGKELAEMAGKQAV